MSVVDRLRENWRIVLLVLFVVSSGVFLFVPGAGAGGGDGTGTTANASSGPTNLQFGLDLSGGTRIRAPLVGLTAEDVDLGDQNPNDVERAVASQLGVSPADVQVRLPDEQGETTSVELFANDVVQSDDGRERFASALRATGFDVQTSQVRVGVTDETVDQSVTVLSRKVNSAGLSGGSVTSATSPDGQTFIVVEVPGQNREDTVDLISERGTVLVVAHFPGENGEYRNVPLFSQSGIQNVEPVQTGQRGGYEVPLSLEPDAAENFSSSMQQFGFTGQGVQSCRYSQNPDDAGYCLYTVSNGRIVDGEIVEGTVVSAAGMSPGLAQTLRSGDFVKQPDFVITTPTQQEAQELQINLRAGALPTELNLDAGTSSFLSPSLGDEFKFLSLVTGAIAILAVAGAVFVRYREPGVAIPMLFTAAAEVFILLGFSALVGLAINLSFIAGFIAVIGTGVDDLIIIADEILQGGDVNTDRVFESRFRKAFWVIGAAAATTIIAMSPLAVLSLGDLRGFAIVTIVGVLIGVLVTRPAYGDILRNIVLE